MIRYDLRCARGHTFEAWFASSAAYDEQHAGGQVLCVVCGTREVEKQLMAPAVIGGQEAGRSAGGDGAGIPDGALTRPASPAEAILRRLRRHIEESSEYVGQEFVAEARRIHVGEAEERPIWGEARLEDAKALKDEGIPVTPIPWMRRTDG